MANYPKKMTDPTEAALSAIQEALNIRDEDDRADPHQDVGVFRPAADEERPQPAAPIFDEAFDAEAIRANAEQPAPPAANDRCWCWLAP
jgi:hypothetical protein